MSSPVIDSDIENECYSPVNVRKHRVTKGVNSQSVYHDEDSALIKEAKTKRWVFHMPGDDMSFNFQYNNCRWPEEMSVASKLSLEPGDCVLMKIGEKADYAYLSAIVEEKDLTMVEKVVHKKIVQRSKEQPEVVLKHISFIR